MSGTVAPDRALPAAYVGLALTIVAIVVPYVDHATGNLLATHIRAGYPRYTTSRINHAATMYLVYLSTLGGLGILTWLGAIRMIARHRRLAPVLTTPAFVIGTGIALFNVMITDTSGETGLPILIGLTGLVPSAAGLVVVIMLWLHRSPEASRRLSLKGQA